MAFLNQKITKGGFQKLLFHLVFWSVWITLPIINAGDNERHRQFSIAMLPVVFAYIPLFLINTDLLIPRILRKKGVWPYLASLVVLVVLFSVIQMLIKESVVPPHLMRHHWNWFWSYTPVIFVTAIATGYGFITYYIEQEKIRQEEHQERLQSELSFLRSQISPHFIFNILNSMVYLIRSKSDQAEPVTIQLSELMRYMLYESSDALVPLDKELEYLHNYIDLQRIRFEEDVEIKLSIEGTPAGQIIEPMLIIPFVENAFKHGVGLIQDPVIDVEILYDAADLHFTVRNKIAHEMEEKDRSSGIGLRNVKRRLELLYPGAHKVSTIQEGDWFVASLSLHFQKHERASS